jgi:hypothetical protein
MSLVERQYVGDGVPIGKHDDGRVGETDRKIRISPNHLARELDGRPGVEEVTMFGGTLHVTGRDAALLDATVAGLRPDARYRWQRIEAGLEDVFISLMIRAGRKGAA